MGTRRDYYEILGIKRDADDNAIKKAYRKLAKKYHPDSASGNAQAEERFKEVTEAYEVLSDPEKRKLYDRFGHAAFDGSMGENAEDFYRQGGNGFYRHTGPGGSYQEYHFDGDSMDDILKNMFGGGFQGDGFFHGGFDNSNYGRERFSRDGSDLQAEITISFDEAVFGCEKVIDLPDIDGLSGMGKTLKVRIPAGIDTGKSIRLQGQGMPGRGGRPGNLLLKVNVREKAGYERKDMDVYTTVDVPFTTAVFGGEAVVPTLYGNVICKIAAGTQSRTKIRLKGKGIVSMKNPNQYGDQYATVQIQVPRNLNEEAKQKLREFEKACGNRHAA